MSSKYVNNNMDGTPYDLKTNQKPSYFVTDDLMHSVGLYSRDEIETYRFNNFSRFGRVLDPYGKVNAGREYLFFVKPDLHLCAPGNNTSADIYTMTGQKVNAEDVYKSNNLTLNPQLQKHGYFKYLIDTHPQVLKELQYSIYNRPFTYLLSSSVSGTLGLDSSSARTLDNSATMFGTTYNYLQDSEASDEAYSFSLEFVDDIQLNTYHFFKAYSEYHIVRKSGLVTPPSLDYYRNRRLHNTMGIYKIIVAEDMETILYWAYLCGVYPTSSPREAFTDPSFSDGLTFSVNFEAAFVEDMSLNIILQFNRLMKNTMAVRGRSDAAFLPIVYQNYIPGAENYRKNFKGYIDTNKEWRGNNIDRVNGTLPIAALIDTAPPTPSGAKSNVYKLRWYG